MGWVDQLTLLRTLAAAVGPRPDQLHEPPPKGLPPPGAAAGFSRRVIIVAGPPPGGGFFFYSPTAARNNLIYSITARAGHDSFGNTVFQGATAYQVTGGVYTALNMQAGAGIAAGFQWFQSPTDQTDVYAAQFPLQMFQIAPGSNGLSMAGFAAAPPSFWNAPLVTINPVSLNTAETWHALSYASGWSNTGGTAVTGQYRLTNDNAVWIVGDAAHASFSGNSTIATLPAAYFPAHVVSSGTDGNVHWFQLDQAGNFSIQQAGGATTRVRFDVRFPLDA